MSIIGFLGPRGTFTEGAARTYLAALHGGSKSEETVLSQAPLRTAVELKPTLQPFADIPELLWAVEAGTIYEAIVPVENSIEGTINVTIDMLVHDVELSIVAEIVLPIRHHLLVRPEMEGRRINTVVSHPQALAQCRRWLEVNLPGVSMEAALSTAAAAAKAGTAREVGVAAIGNSLCAQLYGLTVVASDIQDESTNATRFFALRRSPRDNDGSREPLSTAHEAAGMLHGVHEQRSYRYKTSIAFAFAADGPGNLYGALGEFARRGINLTKLESRPARQALGRYIFFVDLEGHAHDPAVASALEALKRECTFVKVLGSYGRIAAPPAEP